MQQIIPAMRNYVCPRVARAPVIDGNLSKPAWNAAPWSAPFVDIEGDAKPDPVLQTRVKMLWDDECLYIGAELVEPHVWATLTQRDSVIFHDNDFEVFLNPSADNHNYYEFEINALNTVWDLLLRKPYRDGGDADSRWSINGVRHAVRVAGTLNDPSDVDEGWTVEIAMPWRAFDAHTKTPRAPRRDEQWRINFSRVEWDHRIEDGRYEKIPDRPEHNWVWSPMGVIDMHRPERWGYVQFSENAETTFAPDPWSPVREALRRVYEAQRDFNQEHGRYADSMTQLLQAFPKAESAHESLLGPVEIESGVEIEQGYVASVPARHLGVTRRWSIRSDSLITWRIVENG